MAKRKKKPKKKGILRRLFTIAILLFISFIIGGFVKTGGQTALEKLDGMTGAAVFQKSHDKLIGYLDDLVNEGNQVVKVKRPSGKTIKSLKKLKGPMEDISEEESKAIEKIIEEKNGK